MAYSQIDLDTIKSAIAKGVRKTRLNGREIEFQSVTQMIKAKDDIQRELSLQAQDTSPLSRRPRAYRAKTSKGL